MAGASEIKNVLSSEGMKGQFTLLYGTGQGVYERQAARYGALLDNFGKRFPGGADVGLFSAPGRTEVGGNHTDHNGGRVLAAAVDLDIIAAVSKNGDGIIRIVSEGHEPNRVDVNDLDIDENERYDSNALVRGVCAGLKNAGYAVGGFDAYASSDVLKGSGLSSSAAFEVLIVTVLSHLYNGGGIDAITAAKIAQFAENKYFGKPCGLMDQTTCAAGGFVTIDFKDFDSPVMKKVGYDFSESGFTMVIVDTGGSHSDLNEDYGAIEGEMKQVAAVFGGKVLRGFDERRLLENIAGLRGKVSDRAILRAMHFFADDLRVVRQVEALERGDFGRFMGLVVESGYSSWTLCQNCYSTKDVAEQGVAIALAVSERLLKGKGAWRVHGGGFAGTVQAFVPNGMLDTYTAEMKRIFGGKSCHELIVRPVGGVRVF